MKWCIESSANSELQVASSERRWLRRSPGNRGVSSSKNLKGSEVASWFVGSGRVEHSFHIGEGGVNRGRGVVAQFEILPREIPRPAGENAGLRDDALKVRA